MYEKEEREESQNCILQFLIYFSPPRVEISKKLKSKTLKSCCFLKKKKTFLSKMEPTAKTYYFFL